MSILLESLVQSDKENNDLEKNVPNVDDSHFDDDLFNDDELLKKISFWKFFSLGLLSLLVISWGWFYRAIPAVINSQTSSEKTVAVKVLTDKKNQSVIKLSNIENNKKQSNKAEQEKEITSLEKTTYQPKKIQIKSEMNSEFEMGDKTKTNTLEKTDNSSNNRIEEFESLSDELLSEMPELEISSYAVSSNAKKSFVVLNGAFYAEGEVISPNMTLIKITKENIVVNYKNRLIRKKYSL